MRRRRTLPSRYRRLRASAITACRPDPRSPVLVLAAWASFPGLVARSHTWQAAAEPCPDGARRLLKEHTPHETLGAAAPRVESDHR
jgi:hypothetical protein